MYSTVNAWIKQMIIIVMKFNYSMNLYGILLCVMLLWQYYIAICVVIIFYKHDMNYTMFYKTNLSIGFVFVHCRFI